MVMRYRGCFGLSFSACITADRVLGPSESLIGLIESITKSVLPRLWAKCPRTSSELCIISKLTFISSACARSISFSVCFEDMGVYFLVDTSLALCGFWQDKYFVVILQFYRLQKA